jgi:2-polyprenyl-3-methyl-5-hydroxy-6-metoxy-1,4-benzoquinol methylase
VDTTMNLYDDVSPDVAGLLKAQTASLPVPDPRARSADGLGLLARLASRARLYATAALVASGLHRRLVYANLRLAWFDEFREYWTTELGYRPIHPHDFYFLLGVYRQRLQTIDFPHLSDPALASDVKHLESWRDRRAVYYLFAHTFRVALAPLRVHRLLRWIPRGGRVAEFGCGVAPVTTALARHYRHLDLQLVCADIPHLIFHYARWKFRDCPFVTPVAIEPDDDAPLSGPFDTIVCLEVLEHVPRPIAVLKHFHDVLKPGGHLVFDFIRSEAKGYDAATALRDRTPALEFVRDHFDVVAGAIPFDGVDAGAVVVRRRASCPGR